MTRLAAGAARRQLRHRPRRGASGWSANSAAASRLLPISCSATGQPTRSLDGGRCCSRARTCSARPSGARSVARQPHRLRAAEPDDGAQPRHARRPPGSRGLARASTAWQVARRRERERVELFDLVGLPDHAYRCSAIRTSCRAASSSASASPWRSPASPTCSCSTSRRPASMSRRSNRSSICLTIFGRANRHGDALCHP